MFGLTMLMLMVQNQHDGGQMAPTAENPIIETTLGLSLAGVLLSGFIVLIALMIFVPLVAGWYRERLHTTHNKIYH